MSAEDASCVATEENHNVASAGTPIQLALRQRPVNLVDQDGDICKHYNLASVRLLQSHVHVFPI
jgi:hypothetical protein